MSQNYQPYAEYKDSGVEWLGDIPGHWEVIPLKHVSTCNDDVLPESTPESFEFEYIDIGSVSKIGGVVTKESFTFSVAPSRARRKVKSGDVLVSTVRTYLEAVAGISEKEQNCIASTGFAVIRPKTVDSGFAKYYMISPYFIGEVVSRSTGVSYPAINSSELTKIPISFPPIKEQRTIAAFLDHETARIDLLIAKQQRLIELLKEKRQAVISHAVTKGLNPNVSMKDSGVEWLGEVPEHWDVKRLKLVAELQSGIAKGKELADVETVSVPMLRVANVQDGYVDLRDVQNIEIEEHSLKRYRLRSGDVLMNEGGDSDKLGRGAVWYGQIEPCIHQNHVFAIRPHYVEPEWIQRVTESPYARFHFYRVAKQSTNLASISSSNIRETPLLVPPLSERKQIMAFLDHETSRIDQLIDKQQSLIGLAKERRIAIISAAVTGKIDLRGWQTPGEWPLVADNPAEYGEQP